MEVRHVARVLRAHANLNQALVNFAQRVFKVEDADTRRGAPLTEEALSLPHRVREAEGEQTLSHTGIGDEKHEFPSREPRSPEPVHLRWVAGEKLGEV